MVARGHRRSQGKAELYTRQSPQILKALRDTAIADSLFSQLGKHEIFTPTKTYPPMTVTELVAATPEFTL